MKHIQRRIQEGDLKVACFREDMEGTLWFKNRLVVPRREALKKKILDEAHASRYSFIHVVARCIMIYGNNSSGQG
jgi:hypothetical protein